MQLMSPDRLVCSDRRNQNDMFNKIAHRSQTFTVRNARTITVWFHQFFWPKASFTIAWGNAPGKDVTSTFWLKVIINGIEYGFQPKMQSNNSTRGVAPG